MVDIFFIINELYYNLANNFISKTFFSNLLYLKIFGSLK